MNTTSKDVARIKRQLEREKRQRNRRMNQHLNLQRMYEFDSTMPSAPPLEQMEQVSGYESTSFNEVSVPPPSAFFAVNSAEDTLNHSTQPSLHNISEQSARQALIAYSKKHCCYGSSAAQNMAITKLKYMSAFHYELQSFTEKRETAWKFIPYGGGEVDGAENGPAPLPWDIVVEPAELFRNEEKFIRVPHTSSVKQCHMCKGGGYIICSECTGKGWIRCHMCTENGFRTQMTTANCMHCSMSRYGRGRRECSNCNVKGKLACSSCETYGHILCYIQLTVSWKTNTSEYIIENISLPERIVRFASGQVAYEEEGVRVVPLTAFPDEAINMASAQLIHQHGVKFQERRILAQRQQVRAVPITSVKYKWKRHNGEFWLCGYENKVYAPDYPQTCSCGCCIS